MHAILHMVSSGATYSWGLGASSLIGRIVLRRGGGFRRRRGGGLFRSERPLYHFGNGNIRGAKKLYFGCRTYLEEYGDWHEGLNLERFLRELEACCQQIVASQEEFPKIDIDPELIPEIHLESNPA